MVEIRSRILLHLEVACVVACHLGCCQVVVVDWHFTRPTLVQIGLLCLGFLVAAIYLRFALLSAAPEVTLGYDLATTDEESDRLAGDLVAHDSASGFRFGVEGMVAQLAVCELLLGLRVMVPPIADVGRAVD